MMLFLTLCGEAEHTARTIGTMVTAVQTIMIYIEKTKNGNRLYADVSIYYVYLRIRTA